MYGNGSNGIECLIGFVFAHSLGKNLKPLKNHWKKKATKYWVIDSHRWLHLIDIIWNKWPVFMIQCHILMIVVRRATFSTIFHMAHYSFCFYLFYRYISRFFNFNSFITLQSSSWYSIVKKLKIYNFNVAMNGYLCHLFEV